MINLERIIGFAETAPLPDFLYSQGINYLVGTQKKRLIKTKYSDEQFANEMINFPIAANTQEANEQHYEIPSEFFAIVLGPHRKYSCCFFEADTTTLIQAEENALSETCKRANLEDGQEVLELGCGWGSLSLYMALKYPNSKITSVSNSNSQREYIENQALVRGVKNPIVITADMNDFNVDKKFDRIVSVEMFEHMSNWKSLLERARTWLKIDGFIFIHIFTHKSHSYRFDLNDPADWIGRYFFSGGIMPSHNLMAQMGNIFTIENVWNWNGTHYKKTADLWLRNFDENREKIANIFRVTYGKDYQIWMRRWRLFFLSTSGLFGFDDGKEWSISHYLMRPIN